MTSAEQPSPIVSVRDLTKRFGGRGSWFRGEQEAVDAVTGISFDIRAGGSLALVGESGSGKTTTARIVVGLESPTSGEVMVAGRPVGSNSDRRRRREMAKIVQMVFQDPYVSLDPRQSIRRMLDEIVEFHTDIRPEQRAERIAALVESVGLPSRALSSLPRELSGGQRQRAAIAKALASEPELLVLDEAVSALDTSVQAQILNLLQDLRTELNLTYLVISHDLAVARQIADEIMVMYRGTVVETGTIAAVLSDPRHPYTRQLLESVPRVGMGLPRRTVAADEGQIGGCRFRDRCSQRFERCEEEPELLPVGDGDRRSRCWLVDEA